MTGFLLGMQIYEKKSSIFAHAKNESTVCLPRKLIENRKNYFILVYISIL